VKRGMWLPSDEEPKHVLSARLDKSKIPVNGYLRILSRLDESIIFIKDGMIIGAWNLNTISLKEDYENKAMDKVDINSESAIEIFEMGNKLLETIMELNEEVKLSSSVEIDIILDKVQDSDASRDNLLSKYRIKEISENDVENLINDYKSKIGGG
jgi:hypothetical protein